jgi:uncharacterized membrane protein
LTDQNTPPASPAADVTEPSLGLITDGAHYLVAGQFPTLEETQAAYAALEHIEETTRLRIDTVIIASADADGQIHLHQATDHSTKAGLKWGVVGGVVLGIVFPPSILASAVGVGVVGSVLGKVRNVRHRTDISDALKGVIDPGMSGLLVLAEDTAVVEIEKALAKADRIVATAVDHQVALEIDREAAAAKASIAAG